MAIKTHTTKAGRIVIKLDGRSDYYGGALVQGAIVCRISVPGNSNPEQVVSSLPRVPNAGAEYIDAIRADVPGIRVYSWRRVQ